MFVLFCSLSSLFELVLFSNLFVRYQFVRCSLSNFFVRDVRFDVRFECSVICISLNLFKNVRAVEMFVWLLGLVVHLSVFAGWERERLLRNHFRLFFSIHERPKRDRRERWLPSIFHFFYFSIRYFRRKGRPRVNLPRVNLSISHLATFEPFLSN